MHDMCVLKRVTEITHFFNCKARFCTQPSTASAQSDNAYPYARVRRRPHQHNSLRHSITRSSLAAACSTSAKQLSLSHQNKPYVTTAKLHHELRATCSGLRAWIVGSQPPEASDLASSRKSYDFKDVEF